MARAAAVLALAVCCLLAATAPARRPADLPPRALDAVVDREAAAEPVRDAGRHEAADQRTAVAVPEEAAVLAVAVREEDPARGEGPRRRHRSSLLCLVFRCGSEPAEAGSALVARRGSSEEPTATVGWGRPAVPVDADDEEVEQRAYETDSDSDWDSDSDDEGEEHIRILGWLWRLADRF